MPSQGRGRGRGPSVRIVGSRPFPGSGARKPASRWRQPLPGLLGGGRGPHPQASRLRFPHLRLNTSIPRPTLCPEPPRGRAAPVRGSEPRPWRAQRRDRAGGELAGVAVRAVRVRGWPRAAGWEAGLQESEQREGCRALVQSLRILGILVSGWGSGAEPSGFGPGPEYGPTLDETPQRPAPVPPHPSQAAHEWQAVSPRLPGKGEVGEGWR